MSAGENRAGWANLLVREHIWRRIRSALY